MQSYAYFKIPLETFVTDSQYMDHDQDFTISPDFEPFGVRPPPHHAETELRKYALNTPSCPTEGRGLFSG